DDEILDQLFARARQLADDPLQSFLIGLNLFAELMADMTEGHPGCLVATYCYQERLFDSEIRALNREAVLRWRSRFLVILQEIADIYPPRDGIELEPLADMVSTIIEGGIIMSRALGEPPVLAQQVVLLRSYIKLLFTPQSMIPQPRSEERPPAFSSAV
ncbi:MAG: hypothetical protein AB7S46_06275, partial [Flavobacteriaceae bacterium]